MPVAEESNFGKLQLAMLVGFGGLLCLMIAAGAGALSVLRNLHTEEENLRRALAARSESVSVLCYSLHFYSERVQQYLLDPELAAGNSEELDRLTSQVDSALRGYPEERTAQERASLETIENLFRWQQNAFASAVAESRDERRWGAARLLSEQLLPLHMQILETSERLRVWNGRQTGEAGRALMARFDQQENKLARQLVVALGAGLILALASAVYIARLESQARRRYHQLALNRSELQSLSARLVEAQESERRSISRELHDEVGQSLGALLVDLGRLTTSIPPERPDLRDQAGGMKAVAERTMQTVRNMALLLRPSMLDDLGLVPALEWQGREVSRRGEMEVEVQSEDVPEDLPDEHRICLYRLVQEALNNAARHSGARNARVLVRREGDRILVSVRDDGEGFDVARTRGLGLLGMEERVKRLGGAFVVESALGHGTVLKAELPIRWPDVPPA